MSVRLLLTDSMWNQIQSVLTTVKTKVGRPPDQQDRMFIEAVLYVARTGLPWRDLPSELGDWSAVYNRLRRWKNNGTWERLWQQLQADELSLADNLFIDSTCVRAHQHAAGALKKKADKRIKPLGGVEVGSPRKSTSVA